MPAKAPRLSGVKAEGGKREEPLKWNPSTLMAADCETASIVKYSERAEFEHKPVSDPGRFPYFPDATAGRGTCHATVRGMASGLAKRYSQ